MSLADLIIQDGSLEQIAAYLAQGEDKNAIDEYGFTPLIESVLVDRIDVAKYLLSEGVLLDKPDLTGRTALHWAADDNNLPFCELLLAHHANPNAYTMGGEPVLVNPLLRQQKPLKKRLIEAGAKLDFAQDFINTKLLGHRYELQGEVDIVDAKAQFIEIEFSGFFPEFTLEIIRDSLSRYQKNFSARHLKRYFDYLERMLKAFSVAIALIKLQQHISELPRYQKQIEALLGNDLLLLPVCYAGHAVSFIRYKEYLVKCDGGENAKKEGGAVIVYRMAHPERFNRDFLMNLLYKRQSKEFVHHDLNAYLGLQTVANLPIEPQITGNCSWANIDASVCGMLFLLLYLDEHCEFEKCVDDAVLFYCHWQEWDKDRALEAILQSFHYANPARNASRATILAAVLYQACQYLVPNDMARASKILSVLSEEKYLPVLNIYVDTLVKDLNHVPGPHAKNLMKILDYFDVSLK